MLDFFASMALLEFFFIHLYVKHHPIIVINESVPLFSLCLWCSLPMQILHLQEVLLFPFPQLKGDVLQSGGKCDLYICSYLLIVAAVILGLTLHELLEFALTGPD
jgi:hypothetical protein